MRVPASPHCWVVTHKGLSIPTCHSPPPCLCTAKWKSAECKLHEGRLQGYSKPEWTAGGSWGPKCRPAPDGPPCLRGTEAELRARS